MMLGVVFVSRDCGEGVLFLTFQPFHLLIQKHGERIFITRMMTATMTVRAQRNGIARPIRTFMRQMLNVVNLKKRRAVLFKRCGLITAFTDAIGILSNPGYDFRVADVSDAANGVLSFMGARSLTVLVCSSIGNPVEGLRDVNELDKSWLEDKLLMIWRIRLVI
jgi:hypothetical protein